MIVVFPVSNVENITLLLLVLATIIMAAFIVALEDCKRKPVFDVANSKLPVIVAKADVDNEAIPVFKPILLFTASIVKVSVSKTTLPAIVVTSLLKLRLLYVVLPCE